MTRYSIGIDVSKDGFHACLSSIDALQQVKVARSGTFTNNGTGFTKFMGWISESCKASDVPLTITMEATGVYYENCALFLFKHGYSISVVLPNKAKKYMAALNLKTKNDKVDAKGLSRMGAEQSLARWQPMGEYFYRLRSLTRHHQSLQEMRTMLANQLHASNLCMYQDKGVAKSLEKMIKTVEEQVKANERAISNHIASDREVAAKVNGIAAIKGVGELTVAVVLGETNGFELFSSISQVVSYAGYDVVENQSGSHSGKTKISKKGNGRIRRILHMSALLVVKHRVGIFKDLYERTVAGHGIKMKSYVAVQKKLLGIIYTLWKKGIMFNEHYRTTMATKDVEVVLSSRASFAEAV